MNQNGNGPSLGRHLNINGIIMSGAYIGANTYTTNTIQMSTAISSLYLTAENYNNYIAAATDKSDKIRKQEFDSRLNTHKLKLFILMYIELGQYYYY